VDHGSSVCLLIGPHAWKGWEPLPFKASKTTIVAQTLASHNLPTNRAKQLIKPSTDLASLRLGIEKKFFGLDLGSLCVMSQWEHVCTFLAPLPYPGCQPNANFFSLKAFLDLWLGTWRVKAFDWGVLWVDLCVKWPSVLEGPRKIDKLWRLSLYTRMETGENTLTIVSSASLASLEKYMSCSLKKMWRNNWTKAGGCTKRNASKHLYYKPGFHSPANL